MIIELILEYQHILSIYLLLIWSLAILSSVSIYISGLFNSYDSSFHAKLTNFINKIAEHGKLNKDSSQIFMISKKYFNHFI